jgi:6-pyruvoyltetrahydropterin/6-carboxytetrahydropterin synthase
LTQAICKRFTFEAAHLVPGHPQCGNLHGHSWQVEIFVKGEVQKEPFNFVLDFGKLKEAWQGLFEKIDHSLIVGDGQYSLSQWNYIKKAFGNTRIFLMDKYLMPTSENLANLIANYFRDSFPNLEIYARVWEGLTAWAESE